MKKLWDLKNDLSYLELEGQGRGIIMEVTRPLLLGPFYYLANPPTVYYEFAGNQGKHQNWVPSIPSHNLWLIFIGMKQKNFFLKKKSKMADFQNRRFSKSPILKIFLWKFHGLVLGLVGLIDAKGIDVAQPM